MRLVKTCPGQNAPSMTFLITHPLCFCPCIASGVPTFTVRQRYRVGGVKLYVGRCKYHSLPSGSTSSRPTCSHKVHITAVHDTGVQPTRRALLQAVTLAVLPSQHALAAVAPANIQPDLVPDQSLYDASDQELRDAAALLQKALNAPDVKTEEALWTELIERYSTVDANWKADVVGRALGNRGNARSRQGKMAEALADYDASIQLCPWSVDPVLNRGVVLESLGRYDESIADYRAVLKVSPNDPSAWNNLGNSTALTGDYQHAAEYYGKAASLAPGFSFAAANKALAMYQLGQTDQSMREMRNLLRRYSDFDDMRAALAAALWELGKEGEAETNLARVDDPRYRSIDWLRNQRHWPPRLLADYEALLAIKSVSPV